MGWARRDWRAMASPADRLEHGSTQRRKQGRIRASRVMYKVSGSSLQSVSRIIWQGPFYSRICRTYADAGCRRDGYPLFERCVLTHQFTYYHYFTLSISDNGIFSCNLALLCKEIDYLGETLVSPSVSSPPGLGRTNAMRLALQALDIAPLIH